MDKIQIGNRWIGKGQPCFIIAEAGVNHNGSLDLALRLVDAAKEAGADAVKFQTWITDKLVTPQAELAAYQKASSTNINCQYELQKRLELNFSQFSRIKAYADQIGILFLSTPNEEESADFLEQLGVLAFKVSSGDITNLPLLAHLAKKRKPIILSTGMSSLGEVESAVRIIRKFGNPPLALLHCVSNYPADPADVNLRAMRTLENAFQVPVGYSDHTLGNEITFAATALGACIIEKHFTLDRNLEGPDHQASAEPTELAEMIKGVRKIETALGNGDKAPATSEMDIAKIARKSLVAAKYIAAGTALTEDMVTIKMPGDGLPPSLLPYLIGRIASENIAANTLIHLHQFK